MGGLFSTPAAPVQDNSAQLMMAQETARQNDLLYAQAEESAAKQREADTASADSLRAIKVRDAEAKAVTDERAARAKKGKKDLLYKSMLGVEEDDKDSHMLKLGGD